MRKHNAAYGMNWCRKRNKKDTRGSQTPGSVKGKSCIASVEQRWMAKTSRSYKHPNYDAWRASCNIKNRFK